MTYVEIRKAAFFFQKTAADLLIKEEDKMTYKTSGVCSRAIDFEIDSENKVRNVRFDGGCSGNTQGVARLVEGMDVNDQPSGGNPLRPTSHILPRPVVKGFKRGSFLI